MSDPHAPHPPMGTGQDGRDPAMKVEKVDVDIADDDVSLEQALGDVVNYEDSYGSEHSMSGMLHQDQLSQGKHSVTLYPILCHIKRGLGSFVGASVPIWCMHRTRIV